MKRKMLMFTSGLVLAAAGILFTTWSDTPSASHRSVIDKAGDPVATLLVNTSNSVAVSVGSSKAGVEPEAKALATTATGTIRSVFSWDPQSVGQVVRQSQVPGATDDVRFAAFSAADACVAVTLPDNQFSRHGVDPTLLNLALESRRRIRVVCDGLSAQGIDFAKLRVSLARIFDGDSAFGGRMVEPTRQSSMEQRKAIAGQISAQLVREGPGALTWLAGGIQALIEDAAADAGRQEKLNVVFRTPGGDLAFALMLAQCQSGHPCGPTSLTMLQMCGFGHLCGTSMEQNLLNAIPSSAQRDQVSAQASAILKAVSTGSLKEIGLIP